MANEEEEYKDRTDIVIDNNVATWILKAEGAIHGTYIGTFKFKVFMLPSEIVAAGRERRELLGENAILASEKERFYAYALPQLKYRVISGPPFWTTARGAYAGDIPDEEVMGLILDAALGAEIKFKHDLEKRKTDAIAKAKAAAEKILAQKSDDKDDGETEESSDQP